MISLLDIVIHTLFPESCLLCGENLLFASDARKPVCRSCLKKIVFLSDRRCGKCSIPLVSEQMLCTRCRQHPFYFERNLSLFNYQGRIRDLIYQFKYLNRRSVALVFAGFLAQILMSMSPASLVPVPSHAQSRRRRGWDHMELIGKVLSKKHNLPVLFLLKRRGGKPQKGLGFEDRKKNIEDSFFIPSSVKQIPDRIILLDDIFTTGATASECARILKRCGVSVVEVVTLAID